MKLANSVPDLRDIDWVRLTFVDVFGTGNAVHLPAARFEEVCARGLPFDGSSLEGRARHLESDMLLVPDPSTLTRIGDRLARCVCIAATVDGVPWPGNPRTALQNILQRVQDVGEVYDAGAELEFYLLDADGEPVDGSGYYDDEERIGATVARAASERLRASGLAIDGCHHEAGPGQYEIDLAPLAPMALADALVLAKQVVREVANEAELRATFMARPIDGQAGSGLHIHQRAGDAFIDDAGRMTPEARQFIAGQLTHARGLSALAAPNVNSYKRLHAGPEAPGAVVWAHSNRAALLRVSSLRSEDWSIEYRGADPAANPYLLIGALLVAGAQGVEAELALGPPSDEDAGGYDPAAATSLRYEPLPRDLDGALDALLADDVLVDAFDSQLLNRLVEGRRAEAEAFRAHVTNWERDAYIDNA